MKSHNIIAMFYLYDYVNFQSCHPTTRHMLPTHQGDEMEHYAHVYKTRPLLHHHRGKSRHTGRENGDPSKRSRRTRVKDQSEANGGKARKNVNFAAGDNKNGKCLILKKYRFDIT